MTKYSAAQWGNRGGKRMKQEIVFTSLWECSVDDTKTFLRNLNIRNSPTRPPPTICFSHSTFSSLCFEKGAYIFPLEEVKFVRSSHSFAGFTQIKSNRS